MRLHMAWVIVWGAPCHWQVAAWALLAWEHTCPPFMGCPGHWGKLMHAQDDFTGGPALHAAHK